MKIGMVLEAPFPPDLRVENEMCSLADAGHEIVLFCMKHDKNQTDEQFNERIFLRRYYIPKEIFKKFRITVLRWPFYAKLWFNFILNYELFDAIHVHDLPMARIGRELSERQNIPFILDLHENYPAAIRIWGHDRRSLGRYFYANRAWSEYEKESVNAADKIIVVVDEAKERLINQGIPEKKVVVISNTLNLNKIESFRETAHRKSSEDLMITYVGGFGNHRGLTVAIKAMPEILSQNQNVKLFLVGDGKDKRALQRYVNDQKLEKNVIFPGWLKLKDALQMIQKSDICIVPYLSTEHTETTIPHKLFQYMYLEKPVLVSSCRPLKRIVTETQSGIVFKAGDSRDFARAVRVLFNHQLRQKMGKNGRKAVLKKYNWNHEISKLLTIYSNRS